MIPRPNPALRPMLFRYVPPGTAVIYRGRPGIKTLEYNIVCIVDGAVERPTSQTIVDVAPDATFDFGGAL